MNRNGKWSFSYLRGLIHSYLNCMKLNIVTKIIAENESQKPNLKHSLVSHTSRRSITLQNSKINNVSPYHGDETNRQKSQNSPKLCPKQNLLTSSKKTNEE